MISVPFTLHIEAPCVNGDAVRIFSVNYETVFNSLIFFRSDRIFFHAPMIRCANKLVRCKKEGPFCTVLPIVKVIAYQFSCYKR
jgi:hypothetical protein